MSVLPAEPFSDRGSV